MPDENSTGGNNTDSQTHNKIAQRNRPTIAKVPVIVIVAATVLIVGAIGMTWATYPNATASVIEPIRHLATYFNDAGVYPPVQQLASAQSAELDMELEVSNEEKIAIFTGFAVIVIGIFLFLARDIILRRKTNYDTEEYASKSDRTYEKYHSEWTDDYEEVGTRKRKRASGDLFGENDGRDLPDYYAVLGVERDATKPEIKEAFRRLAKEVHPDRAGLAGETANEKGKDGDDYGSQGITMAEINEAYGILSDDELKKRYDASIGANSDKTAT